MDHFGGLEVSVKETSICIVDDTGRIVKEVKVASEPAALLKVLGNPTYRFKRIGLEAGPLSQWLFSALAEAELPVVCVETRHMQAVLKAQINKTDRNDSTSMPSPVVLTIRPRWEATAGSTIIFLTAFSRPRVPSSSAPMRRL
jgi:transposase